MGSGSEGVFSVVDRAQLSDFSGGLAIVGSEAGWYCP